ncbi:hypothetical protein ABPG74_006000 [Tetrahymena malaccensis]
MALVGQAQTLSKLQDRYKDYNESESHSEFLFTTSAQKVVKSPKKFDQNVVSIGSEDRSIYSELEKEPHKNFTQICPPEKYRKSEKCQVCNISFQLLNSSKNCQFCGKCVCKECSRRTRRDPQNQENQVRVCDLCHYQILYKRIVESFFKNKIEKDKQRTELNEECEKKKEELYKKQKINEEIKLQTQTIRLKYAHQIEEKKQKISEMKDNQNKKMVDNQGLKEKIQKLQIEGQEQDKELTQLRSKYYELHQHKKDLERLLEEKEEEFVSIKTKYESIQKDIDKKKFQSQQDATNFLEEHPRSKSAMRYQVSIIDYNHINSSINGNSKSSLSNQKNKKKKQRKDQEQLSGYCNKANCRIF